MSRYIATRAIRGANLITQEAEALLTKALAEHGPETPVAFPNTAYYLPTILGMTGREVTKLGELTPVLEHAKDLLHPVPTAQVLDPLPGRDPGLRHGDAAVSRDHRGDPLHLRRRARQLSLDSTWPAARSPAQTVQ